MHSMLITKLGRRSKLRVCTHLKEQTTHQCARFNNCPRLSHECAVKRIYKYLLSSKNEDIIFKPDVSKGLECHVDADFAGGWATGDSTQPETVLSRTGYTISYAGCLIHWCSKLQS